MNVNITSRFKFITGLRRVTSHHILYAETELKHLNLEDKIIHYYYNV